MKKYLLAVCSVLLLTGAVSAVAYNGSGPGPEHDHGYPPDWYGGDRVMPERPAFGGPAPGYDHDHGFPPGGYGNERARPDRRGFGSRTGIRIERDVYEGGYLLRVFTSGIKPEDIEVRVDRGRIRLRSERASRSDWQDDYRRSSVAGFSSFRRSIPLPYDADPGRLEITPGDGVLEVRIPKR
jgi:HSP20 family molecular chaperone IbpA